MKSLLLVSFLTALKITLLPNMELAGWILFCVIIDFITGVIKSLKNRQACTSYGFRRTLSKLSQYLFTIILAIVLVNISPEDHVPGLGILIDFLANGVMVYIIYIEVTSVFENIYAIDPKNTFAQRIIKPILNFLTFKLKNNPATMLEQTGTNEKEIL